MENEKKKCSQCEKTFEIDPEHPFESQCPECCKKWELIAEEYEEDEDGCYMYSSLKVMKKPEEDDNGE
jgi:hypothetical protein